jgi:uncharacterized SAM-binding protein YcdF (DUF218 family)
MSLEKLLLGFISPLSFALILGLIALGLAFARCHDAAPILLAIVLFELWVAAMPAFAGFVTATLEDQYPPVALERAPTADVIIVLGGGIASTLAKVDFADRLGRAYALWQAGKGKTVLISGGNLPWAASDRPEAEFAAALFADKGVPQDSILTEGASSNTYENAVNTAVLWREKGFRTGYLVTTAAHMPRALASFHRAGLDLMPWPAAFQVGRPLVRSVSDLLPDVGALAVTTASVKEWLGLFVYRWRGWA